LATPNGHSHLQFCQLLYTVGTISQKTAAYHVSFKSGT
jgi:hypothetical protein